MGHTVTSSAAFRPLVLRRPLRAASLFALVLATSACNLGGRSAPLAGGNTAPATDTTPAGAASAPDAAVVPKLNQSPSIPSAVRNAQPTTLATIPSLNLPRYMGRWYEVAKYPNRFQRQCVRDTQAEYTLQPNGQVKVVNRCMKADGQLSEAVGAARQVGDAQSPRLQVRFAPEWTSFLPAVWGNYWVIDLDPEYQLAAVSEPSRTFLWVLSRTPQANPAALQALMSRLQAMGFDPARLERAPAPKTPSSGS